MIVDNRFLHGQYGYINDVTLKERLNIGQVTNNSFSKLSRVNPSKDLCSISDYEVPVSGIHRLSSKNIRKRNKILDIIVDDISFQDLFGYWANPFSTNGSFLPFAVLDNEMISKYGIVDIRTKSGYPDPDVIRYYGGGGEFYVDM